MTPTLARGPVHVADSVLMDREVSGSPVLDSKAYVLLPGVPLPVPATITVGQLAAIATATNLRMEQGQPVSLVPFGSLSGLPAHEQPARLGFASEFKVSTYDGRPCLLADFHIAIVLKSHIPTMPVPAVALGPDASRPQYVSKITMFPIGMADAGATGGPARYSRGITMPSSVTAAGELTAKQIPVVSRYQRDHKCSVEEAIRATLDGNVDIDKSEIPALLKYAQGQQGLSTNEVITKYRRAKSDGLLAGPGPAASVRAEDVDSIVNYATRNRISTFEEAARRWKASGAGGR